MDSCPIRLYYTIVFIQGYQEKPESVGAERVSGAPVGSPVYGTTVGGQGKGPQLPSSVGNPVCTRAWALRMVVPLI